MSGSVGRGPVSTSHRAPAASSWGATSIPPSSPAAVDPRPPGPALQSKVGAEPSGPVVQLQSVRPSRVLPDVDHLFQLDIEELAHVVALHVEGPEAGEILPGRNRGILNPVKEVGIGGQLVDLIDQVAIGGGQLAGLIDQVEIVGRRRLVPRRNSAARIAAAGRRAVRGSGRRRIDIRRVVEVVKGVRTDPDDGAVIYFEPSESIEHLGVLTRCHPQPSRVLGETKFIQTGGRGQETFPGVHASGDVQVGKFQRAHHFPQRLRPLGALRAFELQPVRLLGQIGESFCSTRRPCRRNHGRSVKTS